jgi:hypothetical protein
MCTSKGFGKGLFSEIVSGQLGHEGDTIRDGHLGFKGGEKEVTHGVEANPDEAVRVGSVSAHNLVTVADDASWSGLEKVLNQLVKGQITVRIADESHVLCSVVEGLRCPLHTLDKAGDSFIQKSLRKVLTPW